MSLNIDLLETSFQMVDPKGEELAARFYQRLFQKYPAVRPLFTRVNIQQQQKKLLSVLVLLIGNLRKPEKLKAALLELGARHVAYGAVPDHYAAVGENLLAVLEEFFGSAWTKEVRQALAEAYEAIKLTCWRGLNRQPKENIQRIETSTQPSIRTTRDHITEESIPWAEFQQK